MEQSIKNTISMLMVGFQSPGIILWSRHNIGGLSCLGGGLRSLSAIVLKCLLALFNTKCVLLTSNFSGIAKVRKAFKNIKHLTQESQ